MSAAQPPVRPGDLTSRVRIERPVADAGFDGAGSGSWATVVTVWAQVRDVLPSRGEQLADGIEVTTRPARVRMWFRTGLTSAMRLVVLRKQDGSWVDDRVMQIVAGPAELGRRQGLEFMAEDYRPAGNPA